MSSMTHSLCPACREAIRPDRVHNGVTYVWHAVHCGWGHYIGEPWLTEEQAESINRSTAAMRLQITRLESRLAAAEALRNAIEKYLGPEVGGSTGPATPHWLDMVNAIAAFDAGKEPK